MFDVLNETNFWQKSRVGILRKITSIDQRGMNRF